MRVVRVAAFLLLAACGGEAASPPAVPFEEEPRPPGPDGPNAPEEAPAEPLVPVIRIEPDDEDAIDAAVYDALESGQVPGAVVVIGRRDGVVFRRAYGRRAIEPEPEAMTIDTIFDLAPITVPIQGHRSPTKPGMCHQNATTTRCRPKQTHRPIRTRDRSPSWTGWVPSGLGSRSWGSLRFR